MCFFAAVPAVAAGGAGAGAAAGLTTASAINWGAISAGLGAVTAGMSYVGQRRQAAAQRAYQAQASAQERRRFLQEQSSMRMRQAQEHEATNRELGDIALKAREAQSRFVTSAGEAGVSGPSVAMGVDDLTSQWLQTSQDLNRQQAWGDVNAGLALTDAGYRTQQNLIGINRVVPEESLLSGGLRTLAAGASGYRTGMEIKKAKKGIA